MWQVLKIQSSDYLQRQKVGNQWMSAINIGHLKGVKSLCPFVSVQRVLVSLRSSMVCQSAHLLKAYHIHVHESLQSTTLVLVKSSTALIPGTVPQKSMDTLHTLNQSSWMLVKLVSVLPKFRLRFSIVICTWSFDYFFLVSFLTCFCYFHLLLLFLFILRVSLKIFVCLAVIFRFICVVC